MHNQFTLIGRSEGDETPYYVSEMSIAIANVDWLSM